MTRQRWMLACLQVCLIGGLSAAALRLQAETRTLAAGRPPLTSDIAKKSAAFFEWALDLRFTPEQQQAYEGMLVEDWKDGAKRKATVQVLEMMDQLIAAPAEKRNHVQTEIRKTLLDGMQRNGPDAESRWMLAVYEAAHPVGAAVPQEVQTAEGPLDPRLPGKWRAGSTASVQYRDSYTGTMAPTSGSTFFYEFLPDGTYRNNGLMQITTYGCTSSVYRDNAGRYRVEGDRLIIEPSRGVVKSHVCGGQPSEKADKLDKDIHVFHFESDGRGDVLVMNGTDGKSRPDSFHREK